MAERHSLLLVLLVGFISQRESAVVLNGICLDCESKILVPAAGSSTAAPIIRQLAFSFGLVEKGIEVNYISQSMEDAMERLQNPCRKNYELDFAALDYSLTNWINEHPLESTDLVSIPLLADALVFTYHLPNYVLGDDPALILSREVIYDIFFGNLTLWDDQRLLDLNPLLRDKLPNANISLVLRSDPSGSAGTVMSMFSNLDESITGTFTKWPQTISDLPHRIITQGSYGIVSNILTEPNTLAVVAQAYVEEAGLPSAKIRNRDGYIISTGSDLGIFDAIVRAVEDQEREAAALGKKFDLDKLNPADQDGNTSYPFAELIRLVFHTDVNNDCDSRIAMAKFINWMLTDDSALTQVFHYPGFVPLPANLVQPILDNLELLVCDGEQLLAVTYVDFGNNSLTQTIVIFATVLIFISLIILSTLSYKRNNRITRAAGLAFAFFFLLGCIFNYISAIFFAQIPVSSSVCVGRYSFVCLGYALILGAMFAKCWEISRIFYRAEKGDISPFKELPWWMFCRAFFGVVFFEAIFLFIWLIVDAPQSTVIMTDTIDLLAIHDCKVKYAGVWYGLHFTYFAIVLCWGAYLAYRTRDIWQKYNYPNESRSILMSIYNLGFCAVILVPLVTVLGASPPVLFFLISVAILFPTTFALIVVHGPKMVAFLASSIRGSKGSKEKATHEKEKTIKQTHPHTIEMSHTARLLPVKGEGKEKSTEDLEQIPLTSSQHVQDLALTPRHQHSPARDREREREREREHDEPERERERDIGGAGGDGALRERHPQSASLQLKGIRSLEDPRVQKEAPSLASTWRVLNPTSLAISIDKGLGGVGTPGELPERFSDSPDLNESRNPLFEELPAQDL